MQLYHTTTARATGRSYYLQKLPAQQHHGSGYAHPCHSIPEDSLVDSPGYQASDGPAWDGRANLYFTDLDEVHRFCFAHAELNATRDRLEDLVVELSQTRPHP